MRLAKAELTPEGTGFFVDPRAYISELSVLAKELPPGALAFASHPGHYDFRGAQCVKDLELAEISTVRRGDVDLELKFDPNKFKHDAGLRIDYMGVKKLEIAASESGLSPTGIGVVLLDEVLPLEAGCSHEIALIGGMVYIECADLRAYWGGFRKIQHAE